MGYEIGIDGHRLPTRRNPAPKVGEKYGRLTVLHEIEPRRYINSDGRMRYKHYWHCCCECGNETDVAEGALKRGDIRSCGCLRKDVTGRKRKTHGLTGTRLFCIYHGIKSRCYNKNDKYYYNYGGRGITMCDEWLNDFNSFVKWANENGYSDIPYNVGGVSIDRIDNDKGYSPDNCRWATRIEQNNNTRTNRRITVNGETHTVSEWSRITGIELHVINDRIRKHGFTPEESIMKKDFRRKENKRVKTAVQCE